VPPGGYCGGQYNVVVPVYLCPADGTTVSGMSQTTYGGANGFAVSNYGANYLVFGNPDGPSDFQRVQGATTIAKITDGTSKVIYFGEVFGSCGIPNGNPAATSSAAALWADSTLPWRPVMCHNSASKSLPGGYPACLPFQVQPLMFYTCDPARAQSPHV